LSGALGASETIPTLAGSGAARLSCLLDAKHKDGVLMFVEHYREPAPRRRQPDEPDSNEKIIIGSMIGAVAFYFVIACWLLRRVAAAKESSFGDYLSRFRGDNGPHS
jgi:hypothetical protein